MRDLAEININDGGRPVTRSRPTTRDLQLFESEFGEPLPDVLQRLLAFANGGHPEINVIRGAFGQYAINRFYHLSEGDHGSERLLYAIEHWRPILGDKALPFANDGGGNQFFLDLSTAPSPVKLCLHDQGFKVLELTKSFEEFLERLQTDPDML